MSFYRKNSLKFRTSGRICKGCSGLWSSRGDVKRLHAFPFSPRSTGSQNQMRRPSGCRSTATWRGNMAFRLDPSKIQGRPACFICGQISPDNQKTPPVFNLLCHVRIRAILKPPCGAQYPKGGGTRPVRLWPEHFAGTRVGGYGTTEAAEADAGIPFLWSQDTSEANGRGRCQRIFRKMVEEFFKGIGWIVLEMVHRRLGRTNFSV